MNERFIESLSSLGITLTPDISQAFEKYRNYLIQESQVLNLTTILDPEAIYSKHFLDSLTLSKVYPFSNQQVLDVGSGAGFPAIPLKIVFPELKLTLIDATMKKIEFLKRLSERLELSGLTFVHGRIEEMKTKASYDLVVSRAVAKLNLLSELCLPYVKIGGYFIAMKSAHYEAELTTAISAIEKLGGNVKQVELVTIEPELTHALIVIHKTKQTPPEYPRAFGKIKKHPL